MDFFKTLLAAFALNKMDERRAKNKAAKAARKAELARQKNLVKGGK